MISPDILKQSATAGLAGLAVATTVFGVALSTSGPSEATVETSQWTEPVHVSFERAEQVAARAEKRADKTATNRRKQHVDPEARRAALRARNRAARRALRKLQSIESRTADEAKLEAMKVRLHINRAARDVVQQP